MKKVIIWSAEEKKNRERKGTNSLEMMIQLSMMVKKHDYHFRPHDEKRWPVLTDAKIDKRTKRACATLSPGLC